LEEDFNYYKNLPTGRGCMIECDLKYAALSQSKTRKFPLAHERLKIKVKDLNNIQFDYLNVENKTVGQNEKLNLNLKDKEKYVIRHKLLKYYESLGLKVTKVYKTISFKEEA
jgi:hypothetical protein